MWAWVFTIPLSALLAMLFFFIYQVAAFKTFHLFF
jgi:phosphate/sulfate permease